jgi:phage tail-like protein
MTASVVQVPQTEAGITITVTELLDIEDATDTFSKLIAGACGTLTARPLEDMSGIELVISGVFPDNNVGEYIVLRGKYEYKRALYGSPMALIVRRTEDIEDTLIIEDKTVEPLSHYYYSLLVLCEDDDENLYYAYNSEDGFATSYRFKDNDMMQVMRNQLPQSYEDDELMQRYLQMFAWSTDALRSDIDAYINTKHSLQEVQERHLPYLAHLIGWETNRELDEQKQRDEVALAIETYKKKGREESIRGLIDFVTGLEVHFQEGYRRIARNASYRTPTNTDAYARGRQWQPWLTFGPAVVAEGDGTADQTVTLDHSEIELLKVRINGDYWVQVDSFDDSTDEDTHYTLSEGVITFGDGTNGMVVANEQEIEISYQYDGDTRQYTPRKPDSWVNDCGTQITLVTNEGSVLLDNVMMNKVHKIVELLKPSYNLVEILFVPLENLTTEYVEVVEDECDDYVVVSTLSIITDGTEGETTDTESIVVA